METKVQWYHKDVVAIRRIMQGKPAFEARRAGHVL